MKKIFRFTENSLYWDNRWENSGIDKNSFSNLNFYPIKQAEKILNDYKINEKILELGCGAGRVFFHYKNKGYKIKGIEYSKIAVKKIQCLLENKEDVIQGNVLDLPYEDSSFDYILAFGLFHNLEKMEDIETAFIETARVLKVNGKLVFSVRFDSLENNIIEGITKKRNKNKNFNKFHRWHFDLNTTKRILEKSNLLITNIEYSKNVSFLFKYNIFRAKEMKKENFLESTARSEGFKLNCIGQQIDKFLHTFFPKQFSNLLILSVKKK
ncbi:class I SAM-dependent methyltransferase [Halarcobacter sp.]|uniref:class I SAM-dependent methyltransferase n=1 Tax=Halarcobacter sp. TaxID=2321133 RepID=UPI0029F58708|nr:class I SAM-dependent methyltransferase [Halarcobacter sp.]